ncbi:unnamed protein product, partial [Rotaria magnacalcarata]
DTSNHRIQFFSAGQRNGTTIAGVTAVQGNTDNLLNNPRSIALDNQLNLYVADAKQSSYSAMLNIPEPVPPPESVPSIPELGQIYTLSESGIGSSDSGIASPDSGIASSDSGIASSDSRNSTEFSPIPELDESGVTGNS